MSRYTQLLDIMTASAILHASKPMLDTHHLGCAPPPCQVTGGGHSFNEVSFQGDQQGQVRRYRDTLAPKPSIPTPG